MEGTEALGPLGLVFLRDETAATLEVELVVAEVEEAGGEAALLHCPAAGVPGGLVDVVGAEAGFVGGGED